MPYVLSRSSIVNTTTDNRQSGASLAELSDGGYVVVWSSAGQDGYGYGVYSQRYDATGRPVGTETRVNATTDHSQVGPEVVGLAGGGYAVVWQTYIAGFTTTQTVGLFAQQFDASGLPVGGEFRVSTTGNAWNLIALEDGGYVATWVTNEGLISHLNAQRYDVSGKLVGDPKVLTSNSGLFFSTVAPSGDGLIATWRGFEQGQSFTAVQRFELNGAADGPVVRIPAATNSSAVIAQLSDDSHVVVWQTESSLQYQRLRPNGSPMGEIQTVAQAPAGASFLPAITATIDGGFVLAWNLFAPGSAGGVFAQAFREDGTADGGVITLYSSRVTEGEAPSLIATPSGAVTITYAIYSGDAPYFEVQQTRLQSTDLWIGGTRGSDVLVGTGADDRIYGADGNDRLNGGSGSDILNGGDGFDVASYAGVRRHYAATSSSVSGGREGGTDTLVSIEEAAFVDGRLSFDQNGNAAAIVRLYDATFDRPADNAGMNNWLAALGRGLTLKDVAIAFSQSGEFTARYAGTTNDQFVREMYRFSLGREGDAPGIAGWVDHLASGRLTRAEVLLQFSESAEHRAQLAATVDAGVWIQDETTLSIARLYHGVLDRLPDEGGLINWRTAAAGGSTLEGIAAAFMGSAEFTARFGSLTNQQFVEQLYRFTLDREGDAAGIAGWVANLDSGVSRARVVLEFSESPEHIGLTRPLMENGVVYEGYSGHAPAEAAEAAAAEHGGPDGPTSPLGAADKHEAISHDYAGPPHALILPVVADVVVKGGQSSVVQAVETYDPADIVIGFNDHDIDAFVLPALANDAGTALTLLAATRDGDPSSLAGAGAALTRGGHGDIPLSVMPDDTLHLVQADDVSWTRPPMHEPWG